MAFPQVASITPTSFGTGATQHLVAMPATVDANDLLIVFFANDTSTAVTTPANWNLLDSAANGTAVRFSVYYKVAVGNEDGTTVDFVTAASVKAAAQCYRITAASWHGTTAPEIQTTEATGSNSNPDPPSFNPGNWDIEDTLWIAAYGADDDDDASAYPTSYTDGTYTQSDNSPSAASMGTARRELAAASDDPGTFTIAANEEWVAYTLAIRPTLTQTITGSLFSTAPSFSTGTITTTYTLTGSLFAQAPTFFVGEVSQAGAQTLDGVLFAQAPTFFTGTVSSQYTLSGVLFSEAPTFFTGAITTQNTLSGVLFAQAPAFPTGAITTTYQLSGNLFTQAPTFFVGALTQAFVLDGILFAQAPTFFTGTITPGAVTLSGVLFTQAPSFFVGAITTTITIGGVVFAQAPTFFVGAITQTGGGQTLTGILFAQAPTFFVGAITQTGGTQTLTGVLFIKAPSFFIGVITGGTLIAPPFSATISDGGRRAIISSRNRQLIFR